MSKTLFVCAVAALLLGAVPTNGNKLLSHLGLRSQCIRGPGTSNTGTYGPFRTNFYFPRRKNCQEYVNGRFKEQKNSCIQLHIANNVRHQKLTRFIDVARIRNTGSESSYYFECANGKEYGTARRGAPKIQDEGQRRLVGRCTDNNKIATLPFRVADVSRPLLSVAGRPS